MSAVPPPVRDLEFLLQCGSILDLGSRLGRERLPKHAGYREDGAVVLADARRVWRPAPGGGEPRELHLLDCAEPQVADQIGMHPGLWVHAAALPDLDAEATRSLARAGVQSLSVDSGPVGAGEGAWCDQLDLPLPLVVCATYGPGSTPDELVARLERLRAARSLRCLVWLPESPGELVRRAEATDGLLDARLMAVSRLVLPPTVRLRASWAAFGWKMAQFLLTCGADEVAGWGLEEARSWGSTLRPSCVVGRHEARAGVVEAAREPVEVRGCAWES